MNSTNGIDHFIFINGNAKDGLDARRAAGKTAGKEPKKTCNENEKKV